MPKPNPKAETAKAPSRDDPLNTETETGSAYPENKSSRTDANEQGANDNDNEDMHTVLAHINSPSSKS